MSPSTRCRRHRAFRVGRDHRIQGRIDGHAALAGSLRYWEESRSDYVVGPVHHCRCSILAKHRAGPAANVAALYADLYSDLTQATHLAPTFLAAVAVHRLLAAIETASVSGVSQQVNAF